MKCENHPDRIAAHRCLSCDAPLCEPCAIFMENGTTLCDRCSLLAILEAKHQQTHEKLTAKKAQQYRFVNQKRRETLIRKTVLYTFVMITALVCLHVFHRLNTLDNPMVNLSDHPDAVFFILNQAIADYARDNSGEPPDRLDELVGSYLPAKRVGSALLAQFSYEKGIPPSYRLAFRQTAGNPMAGIMFNDEGVERYE